MALNSLAAAEIALRVIRAPNSSAPSLVSVTTNPAGMLRMWSRILRTNGVVQSRGTITPCTLRPRPNDAADETAVIFRRRRRDATQRAASTQLSTAPYGYGVYGTPKHVIDSKLVPDIYGVRVGRGRLGGEA